MRVSATKAGCVAPTDADEHSPPCHLASSRADCRARNGRCRRRRQVDRQEAPLIVMGIEHRQLLMAMHGVGGVVDIERDRLGRACNFCTTLSTMAHVSRIKVRRLWAFSTAWSVGRPAAVPPGRPQVDRKRGPCADHPDHRLPGSRKRCQRVTWARRMSAIECVIRSGSRWSMIAANAGRSGCCLSAIAVAQDTTVGTDPAAVECGGDLLADAWQREWQKRIIVGGGHGRFCPDIESGVDNQSLQTGDAYHARQRIPAMR